MNMGNMSFTNHYTNSSEDSDLDTPSTCSKNNSDDEESDDESSILLEESDTSNEIINATFDSVITIPKKFYECYDISFKDVVAIENALDFYEVISLVFLLFDDTNNSIQVLRSLITGGPEHFPRGKIVEWARTSPEHWKYKLFESLAIIQNRKVLIKLGLCNEDINVMRVAPVYLNKFKKILFSSVCDFLKRDQAQELISRVRCDAKFDEDITLDFDPIFIEFHILFWISQGYINLESEPYLKNLTKHLNDKCFLNAVEKISHETTTMSKNTTSKSKGNTMNSDDEEECYKIVDSNNPGLLVIYNNINFEKNIEKRKEFQNKLPSYPLEDRKGADKDDKNLKQTFNSLKYTVVIRRDIPHDQLVNDIHDTVTKNFKVGHHSILVLCVLSHGAKGVIYGANSIPLGKEQIINSVSGSSPLIGMLANIPKIIIIQACQGNQFFCAEPGPKPDLLEPDGVGFDSPTGAHGSRKVKDFLSYDPRDIVVCMATVPGFVAFRSLQNGSLYIQKLCQYIKKYHTKKDFYYIMTKVNDKLSKERCIVKNVSENHPLCMIPLFGDNTLRKPLYLTSRRSK